MPKRSMADANAELTQTFNEIYGESDRAAAVVALGYFDETLTSCLTSRFVKMSRERHDALFKDREGAFTSFYAKTLIGHAIGMYGVNTLNDLDYARRIRNRFAHYPSIRTFKHTKIAALCAKMYTAKHMKRKGLVKKYDPDDPKAIYIDSLLQISAVLVRSGPRFEDLYRIPVVEKGPS